MKLASAFGFFAAFALVLYGWGWAVRRVLRAGFPNCPPNCAPSWPATMASGMAAIVFLGGVLNLTRLAYPWAIGCVALAGAGLGIVAVLKDPPKFPGWSSTLVVLVPAAAMLIFFAATQLPPRAYNFHDDFQKYFAHPVRMIETGSVAGSSLNGTGLDTLGGQAFLQGFIVAFFPIRYINGLDAGCAQLLCMLLAGQFTKGRRELLPITLICVLSVVFINPQYVNVSALFTGSFLIMALMPESLTGEARLEENGPNPAVTGLLYAALVALKNTFALFVILHFAALCCVRGAKRTRTAAAGLLFLSPWILLALPRYWDVLQGAAGAGSGIRSSASFSMFSTEPLSYGATPAHYTTLVIAVGISGLMLIWARRKMSMTAAACFATVAAYPIMLYITGPRNSGYSHALRYFVPFAIGVAPAAFGSAALVFSQAFSQTARPPRPAPPPQSAPPRESAWMRLGVPLLIASVPVLAFAPSTRDRAEQAIHAGSVLAFSWLAPDPEYLEYNREVLYGDLREKVAAAQAKVPAGEPAVAWINTPFYLDYARNRITDVDEVGLAAPGARLPDVHFFIWQYAGYAQVDPADDKETMAEAPDLLRRLAAGRLNMTRLLAEKMQHAEKLYDDGNIVVFAEPRP